MSRKGVCMKSMKMIICILLVLWMLLPVTDVFADIDAGIVDLNKPERGTKCHVYDNGTVTYDAEEITQNDILGEGIAVTPGDTLTVAGIEGFRKTVILCYGNEGGELCTVMTVEQAESSRTTYLGTLICDFRIPSGVRYVRPVWGQLARYAPVITINQPMTCEEYYDFIGVPSDAPAEASLLYGKKALFVGDSICYGACDSEGGVAWAGRIAKGTGLQSRNAGQNGYAVSTVRNKTLRIVRHIHEYEGYDFDYVILHGGVNDAMGLMIEGTEAPIGYPSPYWEPKFFDVSTFSGALEELIYYTKEYFPNAKIGYIVNLPTDRPDVVKLSELGSYMKAARAVCNKWDVPYLDLFAEKDVIDLFAADTQKYCQDNIHPTAEGYDVITPIITAWMENMKSPRPADSSDTAGESADVTGENENGEKDAAPSKLPFCIAAGAVALAAVFLTATVIICRKRKNNI